MITQEAFNKALAKATTPLPGSIPKPTVYRLPVKKKYEGWNIIDFFLEVVPRSDKKMWLDKIENKTLLVNGKPANEHTVLKGGYITQHTSEPKTEPEVSTAIQWIYCDDNILIINKPAPIPMHPSGRFFRNSLTEILKLAFPEEDFKIIHRLDANTTGVIIFGRNKEVVKSIGDQFEAKSTQKTYLAQVEGIPNKDYFTSDTKIGSEKTAGGGRASSESGTDAFTEFFVKEKYPDKNETLLEVVPHTGRTNQIRLHLADLGHPIVGDHGYKDINYFKNNPLTYSDDCLFLHAWKLKLKINDTQKEFIASIPDKFKK